MNITRFKVVKDCCVNLAGELDICRIGQYIYPRRSRIKIMLLKEDVVYLTAERTIFDKNRDLMGTLEKEDFQDLLINRYLEKVE